MFTATDLYENKNFLKVVRTISSLRSLLEQKAKKEEKKAAGMKHTLANTTIHNYHLLQAQQAARRRAKRMPAVRKAMRATKVKSLLRNLLQKVRAATAQRRAKRKRRRKKRLKKSQQRSLQ